jgi:hypothetical protein
MKLQVPFVQLPLQFDADVLSREVLALGAGAWRPHPQKYPGNFALPLISVDGDPDSDSISGPMRPTSYLADCPYLTQVLAELGAVWGRTRLMKLIGQAEVTEHADINYYWRERVRVHVPILTRPSVRFLCGEAEVNMRPGECWIFDTWRRHRVLNNADDERIHLVADTVGSVAFWDRVGQGRAPGFNAPADWNARPVPPQAGAPRELDFESVNVPLVMTPWELREHIGFLLRDLPPDPRLASLPSLAARFQTRWQALWSQFGTDRAGWPGYRAALDEFDAQMATIATGVLLANGSVFLSALRAMVLSVALGDRRGATADEARAPASAAPIA